MTHKCNGQPIVAHRVGCFTTDKFAKYFFDFTFVLKQDLNRSASCKTSYPKILWSLEAPRLYLRIHQLLSNITGGWAVLMWSCLPNFKATGYQSHIFLVLVENKQQIKVLVLDRHFGPPKGTTDHPPSTMESPLGDPGCSTLDSTAVPDECQDICRWNKSKQDKSQSYKF